MSQLLFVAALSAAHAQQPLPLSYDLPDTVPMFDQTIVLRGTGTTKGDDCPGALQLALSNLETNRARYNATHIIGVYERYAAREPVATSVSCTYKGKPEAPKKSVVKLEALGIHAGSSPAFPTLTTDRAREIAGALNIDRSMSAAARVMAAPTMALMGGGAREAWEIAEEIRGVLYYPEDVGTIDEGFLPEHNRSTRAATVFRRNVLPKLDAMAEKLGAVPELGGVVFYSGTTHPDTSWEIQTESLRYIVPTEAVAGYVRGQLSTEATLDRILVQYDATSGWSEAPVTLASALD